VKYVVAYLLLYLATLGLLVRYEQFDFVEPLFALVLMGGGFTLIAWLLTRRSEPLPVTEPRRGLLPYLLIVTAFVTWGLGMLPEGQPLRDILAIVTKLLVFVAVPWLLFDRARPQLRMNRRDAAIAGVMSAVLILFQFAFGRGPAVIAEAHLPLGTLIGAIVFAFVWLAIEAGLVEEYFFRRLLQTRLESLTRSQAGGIVITALLFGLVHAPGLYLRPSHTGEDFAGPPSLLFAIGYAIVILSPSGFFLGMLWSRTRNLALVVAVHAATDLIPNVIELAQHFRIASLPAP
jgi:membrane protease YdiL (CAAX protease family)